MVELVLVAFLTGLVTGIAVVWAWYGPRRTRPAWEKDVPTVSGYAMTETLRRAERRDGK